jgi:hypothetical protein
MIQQDEFAARSQLKWRQERDAWILLYRRRRMRLLMATNLALPKNKVPTSDRDFSDSPIGSSSGIFRIQEANICARVKELLSSS